MENYLILFLHLLHNFLVWTFLKIYKMLLMFLKGSYSWRDESSWEEQVKGDSKFAWMKVHNWLQMSLYNERQLERLSRKI